MFPEYSPALLSELLLNGVRVIFYVGFFFLRDLCIYCFTTN